MSDKLDPERNRRSFLKLAGAGALIPLLGIEACAKKEAAPAAPDTAAAPAEPAAPAPPPAAAEPTAPAAAAQPAQAPPPATPEPAAAPPAQAAAPAGNLPHLDAGDPTAKALGYHQDASTVDAAKYPQHVAGQACRKCVQFQGAPGVSWGPCNIFAGKQVNANGWCTAFAAKA
jgi:hypothetical protein